MSTDPTTATLAGADDLTFDKSGALVYAATGAPAWVPGPEDRFEVWDSVAGEWAPASFIDAVHARRYRHIRPLPG